MVADVLRRGHHSTAIALVQDTLELHAITVGLRNGFLHFKNNLQYLYIYTYTEYM